MSVISHAESRRRAVNEVATRDARTGKGFVNRKGTAAYPTWCIPSVLVKEFLQSNKGILEAEYTPVPLAKTTKKGFNEIRVNPEGGWKELLVARMSRTLKVKPEAVVRRLYDIEYGKSQMVNIRWADAACLAMGKFIDSDTDLLTMPGNQNSAKELIQVRAEIAGDELDELEVKRLAKRTLRVVRLILHYPHNAERLASLAPYNCLRPPR